MWLAKANIASKSEGGISVQVFSVIARLNPCNNREEKSITGRSRINGIDSFSFVCGREFVR